MWKAYSEYDGKIIASSPSQFPSTPLVLTGIPPTLDFRIEVLTNNTITSYASSFLEDYVRDGQKYTKDGKILYLVQHGKDIIKIYSSDSDYDQNDNIFNSLRFNQ
ncbi:MAG: hypothetical protein ABID45_03680 [Patescibacteria group bacterium]